MESVYEQIFYLKTLGNWSFFEAYSLPVQLRVWFLKKSIDYNTPKNSENTND
jgi:hypothetical protein